MVRQTGGKKLGTKIYNQYYHHIIFFCWVVLSVSCQKSDKSFSDAQEVHGAQLSVFIVPLVKQLVIKQNQYHRTSLPLHADRTNVENAWIEISRIPKTDVKSGGSSCVITLHRSSTMFEVLLCRMPGTQSSWNCKKGCLTSLSIMQQNQISCCGLFSAISPWKCVSFLFADCTCSSQPWRKCSCMRTRNRTVSRSCCYLIRPHPLFHHLRLPCHPCPYSSCSPKGK